MSSLKLRKCFTAFLVLTFLILPLSLVSAASLKFDPSKCKPVTFKAGDVTVNCRACEDLVYVSNPVDIEH